MRPSRAIAALIILAQISVMLPAEELGAGFLRGLTRLEQHLDRAALERSNEKWERIAEAGLEAAMLEWESAGQYAYERGGYEAARGAALLAYSSEKEKAYAAWAAERYYEERAALESASLAAALREAAEAWVYEDGTPGGSRLVSLEEAWKAQAQWEAEAVQVLLEHIARWEARNGAVYSELMERLSGLGISGAEKEGILEGAARKRAAQAMGEYRQIAVAEGNLLMMAVLYDQASLKRLNEEKAAAAIARDLAREAEAATGEALARLFSLLEGEAGFEGAEGIKLVGEEWLAEFRQAFEAGLEAWNQAELKFLAGRAEWEREAEAVYIGSENAWIKAYESLNMRRRQWEAELEAKLEAGRQQWAASGEELSEEIGRALMEFRAASAEARDVKIKMLEVYADIYGRSREMLAMACDGIEDWYAVWGERYEEVEAFFKWNNTLGLPQGYDAGYLKRTLEHPDMEKLTASVKEIEKVEKQIKLWQEAYLLMLQWNYEQKKKDTLKQKGQVESDLNNANEAIKKQKDIIKETQTQIDGLSKKTHSTSEERSRAAQQLKAQTDKQESARNELKSLERQKVRLEEELFDIKACEAFFPGYERKFADAIAKQRGGGVSSAELSFINGTKWPGWGSMEGLKFYFDGKLWDSGAGLKGWLDLAKKYRVQMDAALNEICAMTGADVLGAYTNELDKEVLKATALASYWQDELMVAEALDHYVQSVLSDTEDAEVTLRALEEAKKAYQASVSEYTKALEEVEAKSFGINAVKAELDAAKAELEKRRQKAAVAREEYGRLVAALNGVDADSYRLGIASLAGSMKEAWEDTASRGEALKKYYESLQNYATAVWLQKRDAAVNTLENGEKPPTDLAILGLSVGGAATLSLSELDVLRAEAEGLSKGSDAEKLLSFTGYAAELRAEKGLYEELKGLYADAAAEDKARIEIQMRALLGELAYYYKACIEERERAVRYIKGEEAITPSEDAEDARYLELRSWLAGQMAGAEVSGNDGRYDHDELFMLADDINKLLEEIDINEKDKFFEKLNDLRGENALFNEAVTRGLDFGVIGNSAARAAYRNARRENGLEVMERDEYIVSRYSGLSLIEADARNSAARKAVRDLMTKYEGIYKSAYSYEDVSFYIKELRKAGEGLGASGSQALEQYIQGLLEYAAARGVFYGGGIYDVAALENASKAAAAEHSVWRSFPYQILSAERYFDIFYSSVYVGLCAEDKGSLLKYGALLVMAELEGDLHKCSGVEGLEAAVKGKQSGLSAKEKETHWSGLFLGLGAAEKEAIFEVIRGLYFGDAGLAHYELYAQWLLYPLSGYWHDSPIAEAVEKYYAAAEAVAAYLEDGQAPAGYNFEGDVGEEWYAYYLAGPEMLYVYLSLGGESATGAGERLEELAPELYGKLESHYRVEETAMAYSPLADGDFETWLEAMGGLADTEKQVVRDMVLYGIAMPGLESYRLSIQADLSKGIEGALLSRLAARDRLAVEGVIALSLAKSAARDEEAWYEYCYAVYADAERRDRQTAWVEKMKALDLASNNNRGLFGSESHAVVKGIVDGKPEGVLKRLEGRQAELASFFTDDTGDEKNAYASIDKILTLASDEELELDDEFMQQLEEKITSSQGSYLYLRQQEVSMRRDMNSLLSQLEATLMSRRTLEMRADAAFAAMQAALKDYDSYRGGAYTSAYEAVEAAYGEYNDAVAAAWEKHEDMKAARLEMRKRQEIYDWAESVYLKGFGENAAAGYQTPKEKLSEVRYAYERAEMSLDVLEEIVAGKKIEDDKYSASFDLYRKESERHYLALAAAYDAAGAIAKQEAAVRKAEYEEYMARIKLVLSTGMSEPGDKAIKAEDVPAVTLAKDKNGKFSVALKNNSGDDNVFSDYFHSMTETVYTVDGEVKLTKAEVETAAWLERIIAKGGSYFQDVMLAAMHVMSLRGRTDRDNWFGKGKDPLDKAAYVAKYQGNFHGMDVGEEYLKIRKAEMLAAYIKIIGSGGAEDIARYLLYRGRTLNAGGGEWEKVILENRSLLKLMTVISNKEKYNRSEGDTYRDIAAAAAATAALNLANPAICIPATAAATAAGITSGTYYTKADAFKDLNKGVIDLMIGSMITNIEKNIGFNDDYKKWTKARDNLKEQQRVLNNMYYGKDERPAAEKVLGVDVFPPLTYTDFTKGLDELFKGGQGQQVSVNEAKGLFTNDLFKKAEAGKSGKVSGAIEAMVKYLADERGKAVDGLEKEAAKLRKEQIEALETYNNAVHAALEVSEADKAGLRRLALLAGDRTLSAAERRAASEAYEELAAKTAPAQDAERAELRLLALEAFGKGSWDSRIHHGSVIGLEHGLSVTRVHMNNNAEAYLAGKQLDLIIAAVRAIDEESALLYEVKMHEMGLLWLDFAKQYAAWEKQAAQVAEIAKEEWRKAEGLLNEGYNKWRREFAMEFEKKDAEWTAGYAAFLTAKGSWVDEQYLYAAGVGNIGLFEHTGTDAGSVISRTLAETMAVAAMETETIDAGAYVEALLAGTGLSALMRHTGSLSARGQDAALKPKQGVERQGVAESLAKAQMVLAATSEDMRQASAKRAAQAAEKLIAEARKQYRERIAAENEGMSKWQDGLVRGDGYMINGGVISRNAVVDATIAGAVRKTQTVHRYEHFNPADAKLKADLSAGAIAGLEADAIMQIANSATLEVKAWGNKLFGNGDIEAKAAARAKLEDDFDAAIAGKLKAGDVKAVAAATAEYVKALEKLGPAEKLNRGGEFGRHMGYAPKFKDWEDINFKKSKDWNVKENGMGQMHLIMLDFQWNAMEEGKGYGELSLPMYDRKMWEDGCWLEAPTLRGLADMGAQIVGTIVGAAASAFLGPIGGAALGAGITLGAQLTNNLFFATLDTEVTGRDAGQVWSDFGKTMSMNALSATISFGVGAAGGSAAVTGLDTGAKALAKGGISAAGAYTSSVANSYIYAIAGDMDWDEANASWYSANTIASTLGAGVSAGLGSYFGSQITNDMTRGQQQLLGGVASLASSTAGEFTKYGVHTIYNLAEGYGWNESLGKAWDDMGGLTLNIVNLEALFDVMLVGISAAAGHGTAGINDLLLEWGLSAQLIGGLRNGLGSIGLLEVDLSKEGFTRGRIGMGGVDVGGAFYNIAVGGEQWFYEEKREKAYKNLETFKLTSDDLIDFKGEFRVSTDGLELDDVIKWYNDTYGFDQDSKYKMTAELMFKLFNDADASKDLLMADKNLHVGLRDKLNENALKSYFENPNGWNDGVSTFFHNFFINEKYVENRYGRMELILDKKALANGIIKPDTSQKNKATFNFIPSKAETDGVASWTRHDKVDVHTFYRLGN